MSTQKDKFALYSKLQALGFTYDEAWALRRIELTLKRWAERECGDGSNWAIERDEKTGKPYNVYHGPGKPSRYPIADREAGALRRMKAIVDARNERATTDAEAGNALIPYHQGDPRGCALYLVKASDIPTLTRAEWLDRNPTYREGDAFERAQARQIDSYYTRGLAVCA